jgi:hypothetical protein
VDIETLLIGVLDGVDNATGLATTRLGGNRVVEGTAFAGGTGALLAVARALTGEAPGTAFFPEATVDERGLTGVGTGEPGGRLTGFFSVEGRRFLGVDGAGDWFAFNAEVGRARVGVSGTGAFAEGLVGEEDDDIGMVWVAKRAINGAWRRDDRIEQIKLWGIERIVTKENDGLSENKLTG